MENNFGELLERFEQIKIPIIQRDYAHGRNNPHAKEVREHFLDAVRDLPDDKKLQLNFVYGNVEGKKLFSPVDGQQRLTTLFLMYLYAYFDDDSWEEKLKKFTYETRESSRSFFEQLVLNRNEGLFKDQKEESSERGNCKETIADQSWFSLGWKQDPTVASALVMLEEITKRFANKREDLRGKLDRILFLFPKTDQLGDADSLYIHLNARGRALSELEITKAALIVSIKYYGFAVEYQGEFSKKFDNVWTDIFWRSEDSENFDRFFNNIITSIGEFLPVDEDTEVKFSKEAIMCIFYLLEYFSSSEQVEGEDKRILKSVSDKIEGNYPDRVKLCALAMFMLKSKGEGSTEYKEWKRITNNLINNTDIDSDTEKKNRYKPAIEAIKKLADHWDNILEYFASEGFASGEVVIKGLNKEQQKEEGIKAHFIKKAEDETLEKLIYNAEDIKYFSGQICSLLFITGIYEEEETVDFSKEKLEKLEKYIKIFEEWFAEDGITTDQNYFFRRALLAYAFDTNKVDGIYPVKVSDYTKSFCGYAAGEDFSWKKRLSNKTFALFFESFIEKVEGSSLEEIIVDCKVSEGNEWYYFIKNKKILEEYIGTGSRQWRISKAGNVWRLLLTRVRSGQQVEVLLAVLASIMNDEDKPREGLIYAKCASDKGRYIYNNLEVTVSYEDDDRRLSFNGIKYDTPEKCKEDLTTVKKNL